MCVWYLVTIIIQTVKTVQELRQPVYHGISSKSVRFDQVRLVLCKCGMMYMYVCMYVHADFTFHGEC